MIKFHDDPSLITNFPPDYSWWEKILSNLILFFLGIFIFPRSSNLLNKQDKKKISQLLKKGDILLLGNLRSTFAVFLHEPITHATLYLGLNKLIHARKNGVEFINLHYLLNYYDTAVILRLKNRSKNKQKIKQAIKYARSKIGYPYNFEFKDTEQAFFCAELVNDAYLQAGYKTNLKSLEVYRNKKTNIIRLTSLKRKILHPVGFLKGNFDIIFLSHNLEIDFYGNLILKK